MIGSAAEYFRKSLPFPAEDHEMIELASIALQKNEPLALHGMVQPPCTLTECGDLSTGWGGIFDVARPDILSDFHGGPFSAVVFSNFEEAQFSADEIQ
jgi:hypothetical protein